MRFDNQRSLLVIYQISTRGQRTQTWKKPSLQRPAKDSAATGGRQRTMLPEEPRPRPWVLSKMGLCCTGWGSVPSARNHEFLNSINPSCSPLHLGIPSQALRTLKYGHPPQPPSVLVLKHRGYWHRKALWLFLHSCTANDTQAQRKR